MPNIKSDKEYMDILSENQKFLPSLDTFPVKNVGNGSK